MAHDADSAATQGGQKRDDSDAEKSIFLRPAARAPDMASAVMATIWIEISTQDS